MNFNIEGMIVLCKMSWQVQEQQRMNTMRHKREKKATKDLIVSTCIHFGYPKGDEVYSPLGKKLSRFVSTVNATYRMKPQFG